MSNPSEYLDPLNLYSDQDSHYANTLLFPAAPPPNLDELKRKYSRRDRRSNHSFDRRSQHESGPDKRSRDAEVVGNTSNKKPRLPEPQPQRKFRSSEKLSGPQKISFLRESAATSTHDLSSHFHLSTQPAALPTPDQEDRWSMSLLQTMVHQAKAQFAAVKGTHSELERLKFLANPYAGIGNSIFMNRAAVKMANLDALYGLVPTTQQPFTYSDLCSGPGGFTQYVTWRRSQSQLPSRGWGLTLRGNQDFHFPAEQTGGWPKGFTAWYGVEDGGRGGSGDICALENVRGYAAMVMKETQDQGVDLVMADGGLSVLGDESFQEHHHHHLVLAEILTMFRTLALGGSFVLKVFDLQTDLSLDLVYLLLRHFRTMSICKPVSSRPTASERYLICQGLLARPESLIAHLERAHSTMSELARPGGPPPTSGHKGHQPSFMSRGERVALGLLELVGILKSECVRVDEEFLEAVSGSSNGIAVRQKEALKEAVAYGAQPDKETWNHAELGEKCARQWGIPMPPPK